MIFRNFSANTRAPKQCQLCGQCSVEISARLGVCRACIVDNFEKAMSVISQVRVQARAKFSLPLKAPKTKNGLSCGDCVNNCSIGEGEFGFCNLVTNDAGQLVRLAGDASKGLFSFYFDPLPTNCVAEPFCAGCTSSGYPTFSYTNGPELGWNNLAVFYQACTFDCLFCQNYQYRESLHRAKPAPASALVEAIRKSTSCICFFGGDPAAQIHHSNAVARLVLAKVQKEGRILRLCWETNGSTRPALLRESAQYALQSGGVIKIDLKAVNNKLNIALCGASNKFSLYNIKSIGKMAEKRPELPLLVVSTLLIPGYILEDDVRALAHYLSTINPAIPLSLLAFYPTFILNDLPTTTREHAYACLAAAKEAGLEKVHIGNKHLLR